MQSTLQVHQTPMANDISNYMVPGKKANLNAEISCVTFNLRPQFYVHKVVGNAFV